MKTNNEKEIHFNTVKRSIAFDKETYLWFLHLLCCSGGSKSLNDSDQISTKQLRKMRLASFIFNFIVLLSFALFLLYSDLFYLFVAFLGFVLLCLYQRAIKQKCSELGVLVVKKYFPELDLKKDSLYYICEKLSIEMNTVSLVDLINIREKNIIASWLIAASIAFSLRFPELDLLKRIVIILFIFYALSNLLNFLRIRIRFCKN